MTSGTSPRETTRREMMKQSLALAGAGALGVHGWTLPALAQDETPVPFTDVPEGFGQPNPASAIRIYDVRNIDGPYTPADSFYTIQHFGKPVIDADGFSLGVSGLVDRPATLTLDDLRGMDSIEIDAGYECSGNSRRLIQGLASNGRWTGVPLRAVLDLVGVQPAAREVVFFGADKGPETVDFRGTPYEIDQPFARSLSLADGMTTGPLLAYALNGAPLTVEQGSPLRLLVPGWYGVSNVKWLSHIRVQSERFLGKWQARWYRTLWSEEIGGETVWHETEVSRLRVKSVIARVTRVGDRHEVLGFVLHDGTPLRGVQVKVDDGAWQAATLDPSTGGQYSWKLFRFAWDGATSGEHTLVSRVTDVDGNVQPTSEALSAIKQTGLEDNSQFPRTVMIA